MNLSPRDIVLEIIAEEGGSIQGKTLIQKKAYFVGVKLEWDLGHQPHFYGPYSPAIESALGDLRGLGFVEEYLLGFGDIRDSGFEAKRYDYVLTEDGQKAVKRLKDRNSEDYLKVKSTLDRIRNASKPDYLTLSVAAKVMYILKNKRKPLDKNAISSEAKELDWAFPKDKDIFKEATDFLITMGLVACGEGKAE